jgi:phosphoribosylanthranilate isomerase
MKIKICGMKDLHNMMEVAALQPDYMGFIFYGRSKRYVFAGQQPDEFASAIRTLHHHFPAIVKTGVFVNAEVKEVIRTAARFEMDMVQLHGDEPPQYCEELKLLDFKIIRAFGIDETFDFSTLDEYSEYCDYFLFDTKSPAHGGSGRKFNWELMRQHRIDKPFFLSGGLAPTDVPAIHDLLKGMNVHALDFNSKLEVEPGIKNIDTCREAVNAVRSVF